MRLILKSINLELWFKMLRILAIIGVLGILLSGFVTLARYGEISSIALVDAILSIADYPGGFFAFSQIIEDSLITDIDLRLGYHTLYRIFYFLGVTNSNIVVDVGFTSTNYLTIFGELIIDFGVLGLMLFFFFFGTIGGYSYKKVKNGDVRFVGILATIYSYIFMSATFSVFSFMTTLTALIFFSYINFKKCYYPEDSR
jgi:oligosaccharide repeat unit polymerase